MWDLNDPGAPESTLLPSSQITALNFNLKARSSIASAAADPSTMPRPKPEMHTVRQDVPAAETLSVVYTWHVCMTQDYNVLGAGMYNGQFGVFDLRKGGGMTDVSPIEHSHRWVCLTSAVPCVSRAQTTL